MRLSQFTIGSEQPHPTHRFKNLKNVTIDFAEGHWVTVLIGWNGTGKSNVLEALAIVFRDLVLGQRRPMFRYKLEYLVGKKSLCKVIRLDADPERTTNTIQCDVLYPGKSEFERLSLSAFLEDRSNLPQYVFSYYSGESKRMHEIFRPYLEAYDSKLRSGEDPGLKRLFYALPVHSQFVLLAFLTQQNEAVREVLNEHLGLDPDEGIESVLFVLKQPPWKNSAPDGDPRFWNARGIVSGFLARLMDISLAPVRTSRRVPVSLWNTKTLEFLYLFVKDIHALREMVRGQPPSNFFRDLESTYVSEMIEEVRIRVRLREKGTVTFRELSEGEQQLLTVLGLLRFTAEEESLFLLDEPDTHLNPRWSLDYLRFLKRFVGDNTHAEESSHILLTTHNPIAIAELEREQVQILHAVTNGAGRDIKASHPEEDPRGLGFASIVTSDMFGIASSLDRPTQQLLERQRQLAGKKDLSEQEARTLAQVSEELDRLGFRYFHPDDEYSRYLRHRNQELARRLTASADGEMVEKTLDLSREDREDLANTVIEEILGEDEEEEPKDKIE